MIGHVTDRAWKLFNNSNYNISNINYDSDNDDSDATHKNNPCDVNNSKDNRNNHESQLNCSVRPRKNPIVNISGI